MLRLKLFILFTTVFFLKGKAQFLDKNFYLVDSIEKKESNKNDFIILEKNLKLYKETKSDTVKLEILNEIIETCNDENIWYRYNRLMYSQANTLAEKEQNSQLKRKLISYKALAINNVGFYIQNYTSNPGLSLKFYEQAAAIQEEIGDYKGLISSNNNIADFLYNTGRILEAIDIFQKTLKINEASNNNAALTPVLNNLGDIYMFLGDSAKAYIYIKRALASAMQSGDKLMIAQELQNIGVLEKNRGRIDYSIVCLKKALAIREEIGDINGICKSKSNLAVLYMTKNNYVLAKNYLEDVKKLIVNVDNLSVKAIYHSANYHLYSSLNDINNAIIELEMAVKYYQEIGSTQEELNNSSHLIRLYKTQNLDEKELKLYRRMGELNSKINSAEVRRNALRNTYEFEYAKKEQDFKIEQALKDEKSKSEKRKQKYITTGVSLILLLALIFSFFLFKAFKISKQKNVIISNQKQEVEQQKFLIEEKQKEIVDSINYAKRIQNTLLANDEIITKNLPQHFILFNPKDIVSGDFYWANSIITDGLDLFFIAVCDSTGHGVPGAFMSLLNTNFINEAINEKHIYEPNKVFNYARKRLINSISKENQKDGFDGILVCINKTNNTITYSAANNAPILITKQNELIKLPFDKMPVGKGEKEMEFTLYSINFKPGDWLYIYTDGFADQFGGPDGKKYKYKPLNEFLTSISDLPPEQQSQKLNQKFEDWKGDLEQVDDVCVVGFKL
jgi:serine phosphatase RsbU (regulator of sigma subunit)